MQSRFVKIVAVALFLATLAGPTYASDGRGKEDRGKGFGNLFGKMRKEINQMLRDARKDVRADRHDDDDDDDEDEARSALSICLKAAEESHDAALRAANEERKTTLETARVTFHKAIKDTQKARYEAVLAALATFKASDMGDAAQATFVAAYVKAHVDFRTAKDAAQAAFETAKVPVEAKWKAAKVKADAEFAAAKEKCKAAPAPTPADATAPTAPVIALSGATSNSLVVSWTAPGDDGSTGTAASYDIRYSTLPIVTAADFAAATQVTGEPAPAVAGTSQSMAVSGLSASTTYHFVMKASDEVPNVSVMSNVPSLATLTVADTTAPAAITSLSLSGATSLSLTLTWTAPGDDGSTGTAASYDIRYSTLPIVTAADFAAATQVTGEPAPAVAGTSQSMTVSGLTASTTYHFAVKAQDEASNVSLISNVTSLATLAL